MRTAERVERDVAKSAEAFRTISEVAAELDVPQHVLRFWESKFNQIKPMKRAGGRRYYRPGDIDLLRGIRILLYSDGYTIKGVQKVLKEKGQRYVADVGQSAHAPGAAEKTPPATGDTTAAADNSTAPPVVTATTTLHHEAAGSNVELPLVPPRPQAGAEPAASTVMPANPKPGISPADRAAVENALADLEAIARALHALGD